MAAEHLPLALPSRRRIDWVTLVLALLVVGLGVASALAVGQLGPLVLLAIPLMLIFASAVGQPQLGLAAFLVITVTQLSNVGIKYYGFPSLAQPLAGLLLLLIVVRMALSGERPLGWLRAGPILILYALIWFASLLHAANFEAASQTFIGFAKDALGAVIVIYFIQEPTSFKNALWALLLAVLFMGGISVFQALTGTYQQPYFGFGNWQAQNTGDVGRYRLTGPYDNPNAYAQVLVAIIPLALDRVWQERRFFMRLLAGLIFAIGVLTVFLTYSRGGFLSMLFALGVLLVLRRPNFFPLLITAVLAYGLLQFLPTAYTSRLATLLEFSPTSDTALSDPSFRGRSSENTSAWQMFLDHPWLGVGLGNFKDNYQTYSRTLGLDPRRTPRSPASLYLELLAEQGLVGTLLFAFLTGLIFRELWRARKNFQLAGLNDEGHLVSALFAGFAGYLFAAIFKNSAYANVFWVLVGIALATGQVALASRQRVIDQASDLRRPA